MESKKIPKVSLSPIDITPYLKHESTEPKVFSSIASKGILRTPSLDKFNLKCTVNLFRDDLVKIKTAFLKKDNGSVASSSSFDFQCNDNNKLHIHDNVDSLDISKSKKRVSFSEIVTVIELREYHKCKKCPRIFYTHKALKAHRRKMHKKDRCYVCNYCGDKNFKDRMFFKVHIKLHCDVCSSLFPTRAKCLEHKRTVCRILHKCKTCERSFFKPKHLRDHSYDHIDTCFVCDYCKEKFETKCALAHHMKYLHSKRRPKSLYEVITLGVDRLYLCNFCDKSSVDRDVIIEHVDLLPDLSNRVIKGHKDYYFCDQCKENFETEKEMLVHKWTHYLKSDDKSSDAQKSCNEFCDAQKSCNESSDTRKSCNESCDAQKSCKESSNTQKSCNESSDTQKSCNESSSTQKSCNESSNTQKSCYESSDVQKSCNESGDAQKSGCTSDEFLERPQKDTETNVSKSSMVDDDSQKSSESIAENDDSKDTELSKNSDQIPDKLKPNNILKSILATPSGNSINNTKSKAMSSLEKMLQAPAMPPRTSITDIECKPKTWLEKMLSTPADPPKNILSRVKKYKLNEIPEYMLKPKVVLQRIKINGTISTSDIKLINGDKISKSISITKGTSTEHLTSQVLKKSSESDPKIDCNGNGMVIKDKVTNSDDSKEQELKDIDDFCTGVSKKAVIAKKSRKTLISKHQCTVCGRYLASAYNVRRHLNETHYDLESLRCRMCEEVFVWPSLLLSHKCIRLNHPEMPFQDARPEIHFDNIDETNEGLDPTYCVDFDIPQPVVNVDDATPDAPVSNGFVEIDAQNDFVQMSHGQNNMRASTPKNVMRRRASIMPTSNSFVDIDVQNGFALTSNGQNSMHTSTPRNVMRRRDSVMPYVPMSNGFVEIDTQNGFAQMSYGQNSMRSSTPRNVMRRRDTVMPSPITSDIVPNANNLANGLHNQIASNDFVQPFIRQNNLLQIPNPVFTPSTSGSNNLVPTANELNSAQVRTVSNQVQSFVQKPNSTGNFPLEQLENLGYKLVMEEVPIEF